MMSPQGNNQNAGGSPSSELPEDVQEMQKQLKLLEQQVQEKNEAHKRVLADYQNLLRRSAEEKKALVAYANQNILTDLLPTLDHLELAVQHFEDGSLQMILGGLQKTLENYGVRRIETVGHSFDALTMEAVDTAPGKEGQVVREQRAGYWLHDGVLRHAEVVVGKGKDA